MPTLEVWRCGKCGGDVQIDVVDRAGVYYCGFCGAALTAPALHGSPSYEVRLEHAGATAIPVIKVLAPLSTLTIARDLVNRAPCVVLSDASLERAEQLRQQLIGAGARAVVLQTGGAAPPAQVRPPAVPDPLVLGGMWYAGTEIEARRPSDGSVLASVKIASATFELRIATGGAPVPLCLSIRRGDELPMVIQFNHGLTCSRVLGDPLPLPRQLYQSFARILGTPLQPGTGILALRARRDETTPDLAGVTFAVSPAYPLAYVDDRGGFSPGLDATGKYGCAFALNVPPGPVRVTASVDGASWPEAAALVAPDLVTEIQMWR